MSFKCGRVFDGVWKATQVSAEAASSKIYVTTAFEVGAGWLNKVFPKMTYDVSSGILSWHSGSLK